MERHIAIHAITQIDVMAEIVGNAKGMKPSPFRDELCLRRPILSVIRDAHDSHKHGLLKRGNAFSVSKGQRPDREKAAGYFVGHTYAGGPPLVYEFLGLRTNDGSLHNVGALITAGMMAWWDEMPELRA
jgi:hypothetical protein